MKRLLLAIALLSGLVLAPPAHAQTYDIGVKNFAFKTGSCPDPNGAASISVNQNETVRWTNCDISTDHNLTWSNGGLLPQPLAKNGGSADQQFKSAGFFNYYCSIHNPNGTGNTMSGQVVVKGVVPTTAPAAPTTTIATTSTTAVAQSTTTQSTIDLNGVFDDEEEEESTTSSSSTSTSALDELASGADDDDNGNGLVIFLLILGIAGVGAGGIYAVRRMRTP